MSSSSSSSSSSSGDPSEFNSALGYGIYFGIVIGVPVLYTLLYCIFRFRIVEQGTSMVVERWGRFHRRCDAGLHWLMPFADSARLVTWRLAETSYNARNQQTVTVSQTKMTRVDLRESVMDFPSQPIITRDNVEIQVHPMVLYRIMDPVRAAYETFDLAHAIEKLVQTTLRSIIGDMGLDDTLASREEIERMLQHKIRNVAQNWGLKIMAVELLEIIPTPSIQEAMHKQLAAERIRRAAIVQSDGIREKTRTEAEGDCQSIIAVATGEQQVEVLRAKGLADSRVLIAKAEADAVGIIAESLKEFGVNPTAYLIALRYVETFLAVSTQASKRVVYFPYETDVAGSLREVRA